jgi:adenylate cyclase
MFTDIVGYSALTQSDERQALQVLERHNRLLRPFFPKYNGREVKTIGDSFLIEFDNALDATLCAIEIQKFLHDYNLSTQEGWKIKLRIGVHLGDIVRKNNDILGDAVNIASRIEPLCDAEGVCISEQVYDQVHNKIGYSLQLLKKLELKNVKFATAAYAVVMPWEKPPEPREPKTRRRINSYDKIGQNRLRVAVLPFSNLSPDQNDEYFADGITEELISTISKVSGLEVIARTSVARYKHGNKNIDEIAKELKVGTILEGSVRKDGDKLRITSQLIDARDSGHLWSETYDRRLTDIFAIQSDISQAVAQQLSVRLLAKEKERLQKVPTRNTEAYSLYLRGVRYTDEYPPRLKEGIRCFERAIELDPNFAPVYVSLAKAYHPGLDPEQTLGISFDDRFSRAKTLLQKALQIDASLPEAYLVLSDTKWATNRTREGWLDEERDLKRALELDPNCARAHYYYGLHLEQEGNLDGALQEFRKFLELDPLSTEATNCDFQIGHTLFYKKEYEQAIGHFKKLLKTHPEHADTVHGLLGRVYTQQARFDVSIAELQKALDLSDSDSDPYWIADLGVAYARKGEREEATKMLTKLQEISNSKGYQVNTFLANIKIALGERDESIRLLELANEQREMFPFLLLKVSLHFEEIRSDPRFVALLTKIGLMSPEETARAKS